MTYLEAINKMLSAIGSDPINSWVDSTDIDVANAMRILDENTSRIQREGWDYNTGMYTFKPNEADHKILWDDNIMSFKSTDGKTYSKRGDYLFCNDDDTYQFTQDVQLEVIMKVDFEDLPQAFQQYITAKSALDFQQRYFPDPAVTPILQADLQDAHSEIVDYDIKQAKPNNYLQFSNVANVMQRT